MKLFGRWHRVRPDEPLQDIDPEFPPVHQIIELRLRVETPEGTAGWYSTYSTIMQMTCEQLAITTRYGGPPAPNGWVELFRTVEGLVLESRLKS